MMIIPITEGKRRSGYTPTSERPSTTTTPRLINYRIREIVPRYRDVDIKCAISEMLQRTGRIHCGEDVVALFGFLAWETRENLYALHLDTKHRILCLDQVSLGSLSSSIVHPREVFKSILVSSAAAAIFVHNHPSGDPAPSHEDKKIHQRLTEAGELLGIRVLDHLIIGRNGAFESLVSPGFGAQNENFSRP
ncbi:JAB domain-containing protein [Pelovirga terrestris]|nr:JAB domain-containing protein [Pelovirga terrestris]